MKNMRIKRKKENELEDVEEKMGIEILFNWKLYYEIKEALNMLKELDSSDDIINALTSVLPFYAFSENPSERRKRKEILETVARILNAKIELLKLGERTGIKEDYAKIIKDSIKSDIHYIAQLSVANVLTDTMNKPIVISKEMGESKTELIGIDRLLRRRKREE